MLDLIDSHCHLNYDYSPKSVEDLLREAEQAGVKTLVTIGTNVEDLPAVQKISQDHAQVFHTVGVHPHDVKDMAADALDKLEAAARHPKCVAIGEIGLDYHYDHSPRHLQQDKLREQMDLALKLKKPVVIHSREAEADLLLAAKNYCQRLAGGQIPGVIHCFSSAPEFGKRCVDLGFLISFSGILTFKKSEELRSFAAQVPLEQLMVETDSPYLAPVPLRGKKCEPYMVRYTNEVLAQLHGKSPAEMAAITSKNTRRLFALPQP